MVEVTKLNGSTVLVNAEPIESVEETPDTVLSFVTGKKLINYHNINLKIIMKC